MTGDNFDVLAHTMFLVFNDNVNLLIKTYSNLSETDFRILFKESKINSETLWKQYTTAFRYNLLSFMDHLDIKERKMLLNYIWTNQKRYIK